jgi:putative phage-type endonuclease
VKYHDFEQGSPEWRTWRRTGIGGSDAPEIMGVGYLPGGSVDLLAEKVSGAEREETFAMRRGRVLEAAARAAFVAKYGILVQPACVSREDYPWMLASVDGIDFMGTTLVECKALDQVSHEIAMRGVVPLIVAPQIQHMLMVTDCELCFYCSYSVAKRFGGKDSPSLAVVEVRPDAEYQAALLEAEMKFWDMVIDEREWLRGSRVGNRQEAS